MLITHGKHFAMKRAVRKRLRRSRYCILFKTYNDDGSLRRFIHEIHRIEVIMVFGSKTDCERRDEIRNTDRGMNNQRSIEIVDINRIIFIEDND